MELVFRRRKLGFRTMFYRSFLLNVGCPQRLPNTNAERILLSGVLLANVTLAGIFSGVLYNIFAHDMYYPDMVSLYDLDASGLPLLLTSFNLKDLFGSDHDANSTPIMKSLQGKMKYGLKAMDQVAYYRNVSCFVRENHLPIYNEEYVDDNGSPLLHLIKECPGM